MKRKKKSVYATGGKINYLENPYTELQKDQINKTKAVYEGSNNPFIIGLDMLGQLTQSVGSSIGAADGDKVSPEQVNSSTSMLDSLQSIFAMGGTVGTDPDPRYQIFTDIKNKKYSNKQIVNLENPFPNRSNGWHKLENIKKKYQGFGIASSNTLKTRGKIIKKDNYIPLAEGQHDGFSVTKGNPVVDNSLNTKELLQSLFNNNETFAMGGTTGGSLIEAEGKEVVETPDGNIQELQGPSHEQGGIDLFLPPGTEIFSDRLTGPDGKSMADRKKAREKKAKRIQKLYDNSPSDITLKKTLDRTLTNNETEEQMDLDKMEQARMSYNMGMQMMMGGKSKYNTGGIIPPEGFDTEAFDKYMLSLRNNDNANLFTYDGMVDTGEILGQTVFQEAPENNILPSKDKNNILENIFKDINGITFGDGVGIAGNLISTFGPYANTQRSRATDTANVNSFENFGEDALGKINESKKYVEGQRDNAIQDVRLNSNAQRRRGRNSARGINTQRALDLATTMQENNAQSNIYNQFAQVMQSILSQEAQLENQQDAAVMGGEERRDLADRQDKDNYFSQLAQDISTMGSGLRKTGSDFNQVKTRNTTNNILEDMFPNFKIDGMTGKTKFVSEATGNNSVNYLKIPTESLRADAVKKVSNKQWKWKSGKLYNKAGKQIDLVTLKPIS